MSHIEREIELTFHECRSMSMVVEKAETTTFDTGRLAIKRQMNLDDIVVKRSAFY